MSFISTNYSDKTSKPYSRLTRKQKMLWHSIPCNVFCGSSDSVKICWLLQRGFLQSISNLCQSCFSASPLATLPQTCSRLCRNRSVSQSCIWWSSCFSFTPASSFLHLRWSHSPSRAWLILSQICCPKEIHLFSPLSVSLFFVCSFA